MYNLTNITNTSLPSDIFLYANSVTSGWFWQLILLAAYIVVYISLSYRNPTMKAFTATSFFGGMLAIFMFVLSWIPEITLIISMVVALASFVLLLFSQGQFE